MYPVSTHLSFPRTETKNLKHNTIDHEKFKMIWSIMRLIPFMDETVNNQ